MSLMRLAEFHKFTYEGEIYLYHIKSFDYYRINQALSDDIDRLRQQGVEAIDQIDGELREALAQMGLLNDRQKQLAFPDRTPITGIAMNVAQLCNLSCIYCYGVDGEYGEKGLMNQQTAFQTVDWLIENSLDEPEIKIHFFGGEPLLNFPLIKKVVDYARQAVARAGKTIRFSMTTNGTKFTDEINAYLNENDFAVIISFDGDKQTQDVNRPFKGGQGSYDDAKKKVAGFLQSRNGRGSAARATITGVNVDLSRVRDALSDIGFKSMQATFVTLPTSSIFADKTKKANGSTAAPGNGNGVIKSCGSSCGSNSPTVNKIMKAPAQPVKTSFPVKFINNLPGQDNGSAEPVAVKKAKILERDEAQIAAYQHQSMMEDLEVLARDTLNSIKNREAVRDVAILEIIERLHKKERKYYFCGAGRNYFGVSISGDVYPCHRFVGQKDKVLGNVKDWDASVRQPYLDNYGMSHKKCSRCFARYYCGGGCFHDSIEVNGRMDQPNDRWCQLMRRRLELGIVVYERLDYWDLVHLGLITGREKPAEYMAAATMPAFS